MAVWDLLEEPVVVFAGDREVVTFEPLLLLQPFLFPICPWRLATKWAVSPSLWWVSPWLPSISGSNWNTVSFCRCNTTSGRLFCLLQWWLYQSLDHDEHLLFHPWAGVMAWLVVWSVPHLNFSFGQPGFIFRKIVSINLLLVRNGRRSSLSILMWPLCWGVSDGWGVASRGFTTQATTISIPYESPMQITCFLWFSLASTSTLMI